MALSQKCDYHLAKALELAHQEGAQILGFAITVDEATQIGEVGKFSSEAMSIDRFVEITASAASLLMQDEPESINQHN